MSAQFIRQWQDDPTAEMEITMDISDEQLLVLLYTMRKKMTRRSREARQQGNESGADWAWKVFLRYDEIWQRVRIGREPREDILRDLNAYNKKMTA